MATPRGHDGHRFADALLSAECMRTNPVVLYTAHCRVDRIGGRASTSTGLHVVPKNGMWIEVLEDINDHLTTVRLLPGSHPGIARTSASRAAHGQQVLCRADERDSSTVPRLKRVLAAKARNTVRARPCQTAGSSAFELLC